MHYEMEHPLSWMNDVFLFDQYFNQTHTLHPCETNQIQYKYNNHGNSIYNN